MENTSGNKLNLSNKRNSKHICVGLLAHVDAGKTTLTEAMLYLSGVIQNKGRVDKQSSFLDHDALERKRGITIFAKEARMKLGEIHVNIIDTPGHVDFGAEMERAVSALDLAILVVNAASGIQSHTKTLMTLLERYRIPHFVFINKLDQAGTSRVHTEEKLSQFHERYVSFSDTDSELFFENAAMANEGLMNAFLEQGKLTKSDIANAVFEAKISPIYGGSALHLEGVEELLHGIKEQFLQYTKESPYDPYKAFLSHQGDALRAGKKEAGYGDSEHCVLYVYKISHDSNHTRLTHVKVLQGEVKCRDTIFDEKISQIRRYNGLKYDAVNALECGDIACLAGITALHANEIYDFSEREKYSGKAPSLIPIMNFTLQIEDGMSVTDFLPKLRLLGEEMPELNMVWDKKTESVQVHAMGLVQLEVLQSLCEHRFQTAIRFSKGSVIYKESITGVMEGVGHFEPLRHYAEVHLLLEPLKNCGLVVEASIPADDLESGYQGQVHQTLKEGACKGVLGGFELTDMRIRLLGGLSHQKHTSAGDFREATVRAVRHGLLCLQSIGKTVLLEPILRFTLEIPVENIGRAMTDLNRMKAQFNNPDIIGESAQITGRAPASTIGHYSVELASFTKGRGYLEMEFLSYEPCHNTEEVLSRCDYRAENDPENPAYSVFCNHGEGVLVEWRDVPAWMHMDTGLGFFRKKNEEKVQTTHSDYQKEKAVSEELMEIFERTYGKVTPRIGDWNRPVSKKTEDKTYVFKPKQKQKEYLLIDGYNVIFSWDDLAELAKVSMDAARHELLERVSNYQGFSDTTAIVVFDAYKVERHREEIRKHGNVYTVFTKEAETADHYIEKTVHEIGRKHRVTVVTSDYIEQIIIRSQGCLLLSSREFQKEVENTKKQIMEAANQNTFLTEGSRKNFVFEEWMESENKDKE